MTHSSTPSVFGQLVQLFLPVDCLGCRLAGVVLCPRCRSELVRLFVPVERHGLLPIWSGAAYEGLMRDCVLQLKGTGSRSLVHVLVGETARALARDPPQFAVGAGLLVPVSSGTQTRRSAGCNLSKRLALELSRALRGSPLSIQVIDLLRWNGAHQAQKALGAQQRRTNLVGTIRAVPAAHNREHRVILFDDVATTGSTMVEASRALSAAGWDVAGGITLASARHRRNFDCQAALE